MYRTERLLLRQWNDDDIEPFAVMCADPEVMRHFPATMTRDESSAMVNAIRERFATQGFGLWAVEHDGRFIGYVGLNSTGPGFVTSFSPCREVGWRLAREAWGHGFATEAAREALRVGFEEHSIDTIYSWTSRTNLRSEKVMQRLGMTRRVDLDFVHPATPGWDGAEHIVYSLTAGQWSGYR